MKRGFIDKVHKYERSESRLADYLCIGRAAMSAEISKLQKEGFLTTNRKHFELNVCNDTEFGIKV